MISIYKERSCITSHVDFNSLEGFMSNLLVNFQWLQCIFNFPSLINNSCFEVVLSLIYVAKMCPDTDTEVTPEPRMCKLMLLTAYHFAINVDSVYVYLPACMCVHLHVFVCFGIGHGPRRWVILSGSVGRFRAEDRGEWPNGGRNVEESSSAAVQKDHRKLR